MANSQDTLTIDTAQQVTVPAGTVIFQAGDVCDTFYLIQSGQVRVDLLALNGKSLLLYDINAGETCVMTTACLMSGENYSAQATAQTDVTALALSKQAFRANLDTSEDFRNRVFDAFASRLATVLHRIDEIAFQPIDARLARRLLALQDPQNTITATHDSLASDLGTAREVISRRLRAWEDAGIIHRERGKIAILTPDILLKWSAEGD